MRPVSSVLSLPPFFLAARNGHARSLAEEGGGTAEHDSLKGVQGKKQKEENDESSTNYSKLCETGPPTTPLGANYTETGKRLVISRTAFVVVG